MVAQCKIELTPKQWKAQSNADGDPHARPTLEIPGTTSSGALYEWALGVLGVLIVEATSDSVSYEHPQGGEIYRTS